jgi:hypothetical protein
MCGKKIKYTLPPAALTLYWSGLCWDCDDSKSELVGLKPGHMDVIRIEIDDVI